MVVNFPILHQVDIGRDTMIDMIWRMLQRGRGRRREEAGNSLCHRNSSSKDRSYFLMRVNQIEEGQKRGDT